jgi:hypothetical protein
MTVALLVVALVLAGALVLFGGKLYWKRRIRRWAAAEGLTLVEFRGARFYEGPRPFFRSDNRFAFRIVVEDGAGAVRSGWLTFGSYLSFWPTGRAEVRWIS